MGDETRRWVLAGHDTLTRTGLLRQIDDAENKRLIPYYLTFHDRAIGYYEIEYGLMKDGVTCRQVLKRPGHLSIFAANK